MSSSIKERKKQEISYRVSELEQVLYRNKTANYTRELMRLLAYLIVVSGGKGIVQIEAEDEWVVENFPKTVTFKRGIAFLKSKDVLQAVLTKHGFYKFNNRFLKNIIAPEITIDALVEIDKYLKKKFKEGDVTRKKARKIYKKKKKQEAEVHGGLSSLQLVNKASERTLSKSSTRRLRRDSTELYGQFRTNPSENPKLNIWRERDIEKWRMIDFLGYYIHRYKEETQYENISFLNDQAYIKAKNCIKKIFDDWFGGKRIKLAEYIEWAVKYLTDSDFGGDMPSIDKAFPYPAKNGLYHKFAKANKKKKKKDSAWADSSRWKGEKNGK